MPKKIKNQTNDTNGVAFYTYLYKDPLDGRPVYVGKGQGERAVSHKKFKTNIRLNRLIQLRTSQGLEMNPIINIECDEETAYRMEEFWIDFYGREDIGTGTLYNLTAGGERPPNVKGIKRSDEFKEKLRLANLGKKRPHSEETKKKISLKSSQYTHTDEAKAKISAANKGRHIGRTLTEEHKEKLRQSSARRGKPSLMKGKPMTEEAKSKQKATWERKRLERINAKEDKNTTNQTT